MTELRTAEHEQHMGCELGLRHLERYALAARTALDAGSTPAARTLVEAMIQAARVQLEALGELERTRMRVIVSQEQPT